MSREKLIDILSSKEYGYSTYEEMADYLIANGVTVQRWIPVTERKPENAADCVCRCIINDCEDVPFYMVLRYILFDKYPHFQHETPGGLKVTHWMPLLEVPKEDAG